MLERIGNYRITDEIGCGGMAVVYRGVQESLGRAVAIKALKTAVATDASLVARFEREATSLASFQHENIITVFDFFRQAGALFIIMEYVEGIDLYDLLDRCGSLPSDVAGIVGLQVARALDYAHFHGVIHRDVKPANIIISKLGTVKLTDFGIARIESSDLTECGIALGTPAYMSPEQVLGQQLEEARAMLRRGDYWQVPLQLVRSLTRGHSSDRLVAEVYKLLAVACIALDRNDLAVTAFMEALLHQPDMGLDPVSTSPKVLQVFVDARTKMREGKP